MLECQTCGAVGDSFFSENYFGEMVCELCGTQSFLQARNETQDAEDMGMDLTTVLKTLKRRVVRKKKRDADGNIMEGERKTRRTSKKEDEKKEDPKLPELVDCVVATQMVLDAMARALVDRVGAETFPAEEYPKAVKELWFKFLHAWGVKGTKPLLRCYNEFFLYVTKEEGEKTDPAVTFNLLEQWDQEWEKKKDKEEGREREEDEDEAKKRQEEEAKEKKRKDDEDKKQGDKSPRVRHRVSDTLNKFSIVDLLGILMLASRVLNLGLLPSDFADWVATGVIPYHNSLATCCYDVPDVRESVKFIAHFFLAYMRRHRATAVHIAYSAHHLQYQLGLRLPPLNVPLAAYRVCSVMGFPGEVFRNFQWISGFMSGEGDQPEPPLLLQAEVDGYPRFKLKPTKKDRARVDAILESEVGIVAHLVVAVKMCANWHEWIYERQHKEDGDEEEKSSDEHPRSRAPPVAFVNEPQLLPRRDLDAFTEFARQVFIDPDRSGIPEVLQEHVEILKKIQEKDELQIPGEDNREGLKQNDLYAYPAIHVDGILAESNEAIEERMKHLRSQDINKDSATSTKGEVEHSSFFYPVFYHDARSALHPAYEHVLEMLCRKINAPIASVLPRLAELDKRMQSLIYHFERTKFHVKLLKEGRAKWDANQNAAKGRTRPNILNVSSSHPKA